jgi:hypothetical protein
VSDDVNNLLNFDATKHDDGIKRDQYGRYVIPDPETGKEKSWTRTTTLSGILDDTTALETWNDRNLAFGIGRREDLYGMAASVATSSEPEDKKVLDQVIKSAREAAAQDAKANTGTALHGFTQRLDLGENGVEVPSIWKDDVAAYLAGLKNFGLWTHGKFIERVLLIPELNAAGTVDRLLDGDAFELSRIGDLKTGRVDGKGRSFAIQLAIYSRATHWFDPATGELHEMPPVDQERGIVIHLPVGKGRCDFYELDLVAGWKAAKVAFAVHKLRKRDNYATPMSKWEAKPDIPVTVTPLDEEGKPNGEPVNVPGVKSVELTPPKRDDSEWAPEEDKPKAKGKGKRKVDHGVDPGVLTDKRDEFQKARDEAVAAAKRGEPMKRKTSKPTCVDCGNPIKGDTKRFVDEESGEIFDPLCDNDFAMRSRPAATERTCTICETQIAVDAYAAHADGHLFDARFEYAKARVRYVLESEGGKADLGGVWANACADIPTFPQGGPRTHEEIDRVAGACSVVEMTHELPFPDLVDPAKAKNTTHKWLQGEQNQHDKQQQLAGSK